MQEIQWLKDMVALFGDSMLQPMTDRDWARLELELAGGQGRTFMQIRNDIVTYRIGADNMRQWVNTTLDQIPYDGPETPEQRQERVFNELLTGQRSFSEIVQLSQGTDVGGGVKTKPGAPPEEEQTREGVGATEELKILTSNSMHWSFDPSTGLWYVAYKLPNSFKFAVFEATPDQMDALFGEGMRPAQFETVEAQQYLARPENYYSGSILEVEGTGGFESEVQRVLTLALDAGRLPEWAEGDPQVMDLLFLAQAEDWSNERLINEIIQLASFQARFEGIEAFTDLNLTMTDAISNYLDYEAGITQLLKQFGMEDQFEQSVIAGLLDQGHSLDDVSNVFGIFERMQDHQPALDAFNQILQAHGMDPLTAEQQFEFLEGNAPTELYDIWEQSSVLEAAGATGLGGVISAADAIALAQATPGTTSYEAALEGLQEAAANILRFRTELDLGSYGLNAEDLIDLSLGLAPRSGMSQAEIGMNMSRAVRAAQGFIDQQAQPFFGFQGGRPQAQSLEALQQTSA